MSDTLLAIITATGLISLLSLSGAVLVFFKRHVLDRLSIFLMAFAAGTFMGTAFLHLLPKATEGVESVTPFLFILLGFGIFFFIENILHWHHSHNGKEGHKSLGAISLLGDGAHNFLDGMIIAAVFFVDIRLGFITAVAVAFHEIPQEIAEFGVLMHAGYSKYRALLFNFISASTVVAGGIVSFFLEGILGQWITLFLFFAVGTFMYIAASDFVPEIRKEAGLRRSFALLLTFAAGILLMWGVLFLE